MTIRHKTNLLCFTSLKIMFIKAPSSSSSQNCPCFYIQTLSAQIKLVMNSNQIISTIVLTINLWKCCPKFYMDFKFLKINWMLSRICLLSVKNMLKICCPLWARLQRQARPACGGLAWYIHKMSPSRLHGFAAMYSDTPQYSLNTYKMTVFIVIYIYIIYICITQIHNYSRNTFIQFG